MPKIDLSKVEVLQMDGSIKVEDLRQDVCKSLWLHHEKDKVMFGQRLWNGGELSDEEAAELRKLIAPMPWVARDGIEQQLAAKKK